MADQGINKKKMIEFDKAVSEMIEKMRPALTAQVERAMNDPAKKREFEARMMAVFKEIVAVPAYSLSATNFGTFKARFGLTEKGNTLVDRKGAKVADFSVTGKTAFGAKAVTNIAFLSAPKPDMKAWLDANSIRPKAVTPTRAKTGYLQEM